MQECKCKRRVQSEQAPHNSSPVARASRRIQISSRTIDNSHQPQRHRRPKGPVASRRELVLNQISGHDGFAAAQQIRREVCAEARDKNQQSRRTETRRAERNHHAPECLTAESSKIRRGFAERRIKPLQRRIQRQHDKRQIPIQQSHEHSTLVVKQRQRRFDDAERHQRRVDQTGITQQKHPRIRSHKEAAPERQHHELKVKVSGGWRGA